MNLSWYTAASPLYCQMPRLLHPTYETSRARACLRAQGVALFQAGLSPQTRPLYRSYIRRYTKALCRAFRIRPFPVSRTALHLYAARWVTSGRAHTTLPSIFAALKHEHRANGWPWLSSTDKAWLRHFMTGVRKTFPHTPVRKQPMTMSLLRRIVARANLADPCEAQFITMVFLCSV